MHGSWDAQALVALNVKIFVIVRFALHKLASDILDILVAKQPASTTKMRVDGGMPSHEMNMNPNPIFC